MKVLWFTNSPSCYKQAGDYNGGGWISSLENIIKETYPEINLGIAFYYNEQNLDSWTRVQDKGVVYYPMSKLKKSYYSYARQLFYGKHWSSMEHEKQAISKLLEIISDFNPDIIHVFGSENIYGILARHTNIPIVLHIQGILSAIINSFLPPAISWNNYILSTFRIKSILWHLSEKYSFERNSFTEIRILKNVKYFMGRTTWDKSIINLINPSARYYTCNEILREVFYSSHERCESLKPIFISVLSWQIYKGYDLVLKTANLLRQLDDIDFEWHIYGNINPKLVERKYQLSSKNTSIVFKGVASSDELRKSFLSATALVHPSYIENSSNVICEAQISGCPCIATNVGGTASLIEDGITGILIPSNDPYMLAYNMKSLMDNSDLRIKLSTNASRVAHERHDKNKIATNVREIYQDIINNHNI